MEHATLWDRFGQGGPVMYVLLALSIVAVACAAERANALRQRCILSPGLCRRADRLWQAKQFDELERLCREDESALAKVVLCIVLHRQRPYAEVNTAAADVANLAIKRHLQKTNLLAAVATLSPLLGLCGTVTGMIAAFDAIAASGGGNPAVVASGIAEALITTATGLFVAIPALAFRHYFMSRVQVLGLNLVDQARGLLESWFLEEARS